VTPADPNVPSGETEPFTATGTLSDGSNEDLTSQVGWVSGTTSVATISNASGSQGLATGIATGASTISATLGGITGSTVLTVSAAVLQSIAVTPANPSVPSGKTEQFTAIGSYSDKSTKDLTTQVVWSSATTGVATISGAPGSQGLAAGLTTGRSAISATLDGITGSTVLTVSPAVLLSIALVQGTSSIVQGSTDQFTATGTFSDKSTANLTSLVTWESAAPLVASITAAALATGVAPGVSAISATLNGVSSSAVLTVTAPAPIPPLVTLMKVVPVLNKRHLVTRIEVIFSGPVNMVEAEQRVLYRLAAPGKKGSFTAKNAHVIKLKSIMIDATGEMVTLTPKAAFALDKPVQLQINGHSPAGLQDSLGRFIDGSGDGQQGGNAVAVIGRKGVVTL
jgi:hypothetical protein